MSELSEQGHKWSKKQRAFMEWEALGKHNRPPELGTQVIFAHKLGVTERTLHRWKNKEGFADEVIALSRLYLRGRLNNIYEALGREAEKGSFQHIKLALEVTGEHTDKTGVEVGGEIKVRFVRPDGV